MLVMKPLMYVSEFLQIEANEMLVLSGSREVAGEGMYLECVTLRDNSERSVTLGAMVFSNCIYSSNHVGRGWINLYSDGTAAESENIMEIIS